ncbi:MAG: ABC transporter ATP-binding protein [Alphaproteobacteria bacterium]|nr:ABC transporter ATP-binding protein [Alphaproteobacteria bacterium]
MPSGSPCVRYCAESSRRGWKLPSTTHTGAGAPTFPVYDRRGQLWRSCTALPYRLAIVPGDPRLSIVVKSLVKRFDTAERGAFLAVDHLSLAIRPGEVYGMLGPNGAGKTTTLRMLATLLSPDEGDAEIAGVSLRADPLEVRRRLAYVPAEAGLPECLTGREVVRLFARIQGVASPRERADALLEAVGAIRYADRACGELSTGMKRRVVLARALVHDPAVLLLDEPTDGLDVPGRREVLALVRQQAASGKAVVLSSHIMGEVERVVDRIGVISQGRLVAEGTLAEVLATAGATTLDDAFIALTGGE